MREVDEPQAKVEERLRAVETGVESLRGETRALREDVSTLKGDVSTLKGDVSTLKGDVSTLKGDVSTLKGEVGKLRILGEQTAGDVKLLAESVSLLADGQRRHGEQLEKIAQALVPLADLHHFVRSVAHEHEKRIAALEKAGGRGGGASDVPTAG